MYTQEVERESMGKPKSARETERLCTGGGHGSVTGALGLV